MGRRPGQTTDDQQRREAAALASNDKPSQAAIADVLEAIGDAVYAMTEDERILFANRRALELWRKSPDEVIGRRLLEVFPGIADGEPYRAYLLSVARIVPRLRSSVAHGSSKPDWLRGFLTELMSIGVFVTLAFLSWSYDSRLMAQAILITFGVSLVVRALLPSASKDQHDITNV